jgi:hypothetical protein
MTSAISGKTAKPRGKPFAKGQSGNPTGRPPKTREELDLIAACRDRAPEALEAMVQIMTNGESERNRLAAAMAIIERGYGKPEQPVTGDVGVFSVIAPWLQQTIQKRNSA